MDFEKLKKSFLDVTKNVTEKAKDFSDKAIAFTWDNLPNNFLFLQTEDEMNEIITQNKRAIFLAFDENDEKLEKELLILLPVWKYKAFIDSSALRYLNKERSEMLIRDKNFLYPIEMRIYYQWQEMRKFSNLEDIKKWWWDEDRKYDLVLDWSSTNIDTDNVDSKDKTNTTSTEFNDPLVEQK